MNLRYGEPPNEADCKDVGVLGVGNTVGVTPDDPHLGGLDYEDVGLPKPPWVKVREATNMLRKHKKPVKARIPGLGTLLLGEDGWKVKEG